MKTVLQYLDAMDEYVGTAVVQEVVHSDRLAVVLDQTIMYPQGGGQPCDIGSLVSRTATFLVSEVRVVDGVVYHYGEYDDQSLQFSVGDAVTVHVAQEQRILHSKIHTAGHVIDMGIQKLGIDWLSGRGYHYPAGPYVEYIGQCDQKTVLQFQADLEATCREIIAADYPCVVTYDTAVYKDDRPLRLVTFGAVTIPCGGTHVSRLSLVTGFTIRKIKQDKERVRISYQVV